MGYKLTISGLHRKRNRLSQAIETARRDLDRMHAELVDIERALHVFGEDELPKPPRPVTRRFKRGQLQRIIFDTVRDGPADFDTITEAVVKAGHGNADSFRERKAVRDAITRALDGLVKRNLLDTYVKGGVVVWKVW